jgi:Flp pilus assembly protein TadG
MNVTSETHGNLEHAAKVHRRFFSESGQSLVELALLAPILVLLVIGVVEMGRYAYLSIVLENSAEAGALYGAQGLANSADTTGIQTAADNDFQNNGQPVSNLTVTSSTACGCDSGGLVISAACNGTSTAGTCTTGHWVVMVNVTAAATFTSLTKFPGIPQSLTITRTVSMRVKPQ